MKKSNLLVLLPALFLFSSCSRPVIVDTITLKEAVDFINEKYKDKDVKIKQPTLDTQVVFKIVQDKNEKAAKDVNYYVNNNPDEAISYDKNKTKKVKINESRAQAFKTEVDDATEGTDFKEVGKDAVIALNQTIYKALYKSQGTENYNFVFKKAYSGKGLKIISQNVDYRSDEQLTRTHIYDKDGHETKFELSYLTKDINYSLTINFKYN